MITLPSLFLHPLIQKICRLCNYTNFTFIFMTNRVSGITLKRLSTRSLTSHTMRSPITHHPLTLFLKTGKLFVTQIITYRLKPFIPNGINLSPDCHLRKVNSPCTIDASIYASSLVWGTKNRYPLPILLHTQFGLRFYFP